MSNNVNSVYRPWFEILPLKLEDCIDFESFMEKCLMENNTSIILEFACMFSQLVSRSVGRLVGQSVTKRNLSTIGLHE